MKQTTEITALVHHNNQHISVQIFVGPHCILCAPTTVLHFVCISRYNMHTDSIVCVYISCTVCTNYTCVYVKSWSGAAKLVLKYKPIPTSFLDGGDWV